MVIKKPGALAVSARMLKEMTLGSFLLVSVVWTMLQLSPELGRFFIFSRDPHTNLAWVYLVGAYLTLIPAYLMKFTRVWKDLSFPATSTVQRTLLSALGALVLPLGILAGPLVLWLGEYALGRPQLFYRIFTRTLIGMGLAGALLTFTAALCAWGLLVGLPRLWKPPAV